MPPPSSLLQSLALSQNYLIDQNAVVNGSSSGGVNVVNGGGGSGAGSGIGCLQTITTPSGIMAAATALKAVDENYYQQPQRQCTLGGLANLDQVANYQNINIQPPPPQTAG